jgi:cell filamentation protein
MTAQRADEPFPAGRLSVRHYCRFHRHLFQDCYRWAGRYRTVRISKGQSTFCYPEHIAGQMRTTFRWLRDRQFLRDLTADTFCEGAAHFFAELNAIHPFRDGNGRTQLSFLALIAEQAGHALILTRLRPRAFLIAAIASFHGDERPLARELRRLLG